MLKTIFDLITNVGVITAAIACIVLMLAVNYKMLAEECIKEERRKARIRSKHEARMLYHQFLRKTEYRVIRNPIVIKNETDIDWGTEQEVRF
ncbi:MAG: hypothetical protein J6U54_03565 [Clostridiales bacterium]|nr:hypothetical protein [Clostridiales bacterium]